MTYRLSLYGGVTDSEGAHIPEDEGNRHWRKYQDWLAEGNDPEPAIQPPVAPRTVERWRWLLALDRLGKRAAWDAAVSASTKDKDKAWALGAPDVVSSNAKLSRLATAAALNAGDITSAFDLAVTL